MTTAPKLEPPDNEALVTIAKHLVAAIDHEIRCGTTLLGSTTATAAAMRELIAAAPSAGLREDNALTPRIETKVVPIHASPGHDGELGLEWEHGGLFFGIEITAKGDATWIIRRDSKFELGGQTWVPGMRPDIEWARTVVDRLDADSTPAMKAKQPDTRGDSALLTLSKEGGGAASPHQTIARDE